MRSWSAMTSAAPVMFAHPAAALTSAPTRFRRTTLSSTRPSRVVLRCSVAKGLRSRAAGVRLSIHRRLQSLVEKRGQATFRQGTVSPVRCYADFFQVGDWPMAPGIVRALCALVLFGLAFDA